MKSTFPRPGLNEKNIQETRERDRKLKDRQNEKVISSKYRTHHQFEIGDKVFPRNFNREQKFGTLFLPKPLEIIGINAVENKLIIRQGNNIFCQYADDLKPYSGSN